MNKKRFYQKSAAALLTVGVLLTQLPAAALGATPQTENTTTTVGETAQPVTYDSVFKIPREAITSITNNAGHYGGSVIANAIDGSRSTHWETNKPNNASFNNAVTVTFDGLYEIATLKYLVRQDGGRPKGFPLEYNIYYSTSESGENFKLLRHGTYASASGSEVSIQVEPTEVRRVRFEFVRAQGNWASMAELSFYRYDELAERIDDVFTDKTYSALSEEYRDAAKLDRLAQLAKVHPDKAKYERFLNAAYELLENPGAFDSRVFTASQRGNFDKEKNRSKISWTMYSYDSTGYYVTPGETIYVYVDADQNSVMPKLLFGQIAKDKNDWRRWFTLKPGLNVITAQTIDKMNPAAIYIYNPALPEDQAYAPRVRIEGGTKFPLYVHGKTDPQDFENELREYLKNVSYNDNDFADGNPNGYYYNIAEVASENCTITTSAAGCLNGITNRPGKTIADTMDIWEDMYYSYAKYSGFDTEDPTSDDYMPRIKFNCRVFCQGPFGWADTGYNGFNGGNSQKRDNNFFSSIVSYNTITSGGWALFHEIGHSYDSAPLGVSESTNNLYSLMMQDKYIPNNRLVTGQLWKNNIEPFHNIADRSTRDAKNIWTYLAVVNQLELVYGRETLYGQAQKIARRDTTGMLGGLNKYERMAVTMSKAAGYDLTGHFEYYCLPIGEKAKSLVADLPKDGKKTYYVNNKYIADDAAAFSNPDAKPVVTTAGSGEIRLNLSIDEPDNAVLCYEIYRNGEKIGVTYSDTYVDKNTEANTVYTYAAIAYDRKLGASQMSEGVQKNSSEPALMTTGDPVVSLRADFDPMRFITAKDAAGVSITDRVVVEADNVNTSEKGTYEVAYRVADTFGNESTLKLPVRVVSDSTYLSDMNWKSAQTGWGSIRKDKSVTQKAISLLSEKGEQTFTKGIGTHANSTIVYDISKSGAQTFEAYVGVDGAMRSANASSLTFEVYVDGVKQYESGVMKKDTPAKFVSMNVKDAKELKLVVTDGGNGNGSDHADWADAKLINDDARPTISGLSYQSCRVGGSVDLMSGVTAYDIEDGDLTGSVEMSTDFTSEQPGVYDVRYSVTDSDGNTTVETRTVAVTNAAVYASDVSWQQASIGWGSIGKDKAVSGNALRLNAGDGSWKTYEKGIGTHAYSQITYDLTGKGFYAFESYIGVDGAMKNSGVSSITFEVYVDGVKRYDSGLMKSNTPQKFVSVNLNGASTLKLVVTAAGNGNGSDHGDWADAKFLTVLDKSELEQVLLEAESKRESDYTEESLAAFTQSRQQAREVLENETATAQQAAEAVQALRSAMDGLVPAIDRQALQDIVDYASRIDSVSYVDPTWKHRDIRYENFVAVMADYAWVLESPDATQQKVDDTVKVLQYFVEELGQTYQAGGTPVKFQ
ncbi:NPCBM/NEW2 domain-containing protein [Candidatus Soleaferrea massiliensis]|uniref:NPCBM/NEW2 domain-containing protein n=1 Tax=Candidatus Soleaferrea massiliensis TaxID=1470354 RepID=UPI00058B449F|nr:NPCBM/NEW2 domain-containing protein [Candidatus Soleaferrea massiliensis]